MERNAFRAALAATVTGVVGASASAGLFTIDFTTDDGGNPLVDGQDISSPPEFGNLFNITSGGPNAGAAIFDSSVGGPNDGPGMPDPDLIVDLGNILILQNNNNAAQSVAGIFDTPDDDLDGGFVEFSFLSPAEMTSVDLIDINGAAATTVTLTDTNGLMRTYNVPSFWTGDVVDNGPPGFGTLFLNTLADQPGPNGPLATAMEDAGFDAMDVTTLRFDFAGSAGIDNLTFIPAPGAAGLLGLAGLAALRRRRP